jgi:hypothetical protein
LAGEAAAEAAAEAVEEDAADDAQSSASTAKVFSVFTPPRLGGCRLAMAARSGVRSEHAPGATGSMVARGSGDSVGGVVGDECECGWRGGDAGAGPPPMSAARKPSLLPTCGPPHKASAPEVGVVGVGPWDASHRSGGGSAWVRRMGAVSMGGGGALLVDGNA